MRDLPTLALTLIQPWGTLIMHCGKDIENRTWEPDSRLRRGDRLWIHAGKSFDSETHRRAIADVPGYYRVADPDLIPRGALLGHVRFDGVVRESTSRWFMGPIGWLLSDPVALAKPIACRGAQGLWRVPADIIERAEGGDA